MWLPQGRSGDKKYKMKTFLLLIGEIYRKPTTIMTTSNHLKSKVLDSVIN